MIDDVCKIHETSEDIEGIVHYRCMLAFGANRESLAYNAGVVGKLEKSGCPFPYECERRLGMPAPSIVPIHQIPLR